MSDREGTKNQQKPPSALTAKVEVWLAGVLMLIAFAVGFVVRGVASDNSTPAPATDQQLTGTTNGIVPAPPLTDQQLQAGLPAGHPALDQTSSSPKKKNNP